MLYLLQLAQALKFESSASDARSSRSITSAVSYDDSGLADFLVARAVNNHVLGYRFYWYLTVEVALEDRLMGKMYGKVIYQFLKQLKEVRHWSFSIIELSLSNLFFSQTRNVDNFLYVRRDSLPLLGSVLRNLVIKRNRGQRESRSYVPSSRIREIIFYRWRHFLSRSMEILK